MAPLQLAVFDLDYTIWKPEMYQICGPPKLVQNDGEQVMDQSGTPITIFDGASYALSEINRINSNHDSNHDSNTNKIQAAIASKTDEPDWARLCLKWLKIQDGSTLHSCFHPRLIEIGYGRKTRHFKNLQQKTGIPFQNMAFFDNEYGNIRDVKQLGVKCIYIPNGMTKTAWNEALCMFDS